MRYAFTALFFLIACLTTASTVHADDVVYLDCQVFFAPLDTENESGMTEHIPITLNYAKNTVNDEAAMFGDRLIRARIGDFDVAIDRYTGNISFRTNAKPIRGSGTCRVVTERKF